MTEQEIRLVSFLRLGQPMPSAHALIKKGDCGVEFDETGYQMLTASNLVRGWTSLAQQYYCIWVE